MNLLLEALPANLGGHVIVTVVPLLLAVACSVPLGILATRRPAVRGPLLGVIGVIQTVPGLALLALMVPLLAWLDGLLGEAVVVPVFGLLPALVALTLYGMLPIARNTVAGIEGVDEGVVVAARGLGMTEAQILREVQLPLAAPVILAGVRTATVWCVGMATLATPIGQTSLGNYIFAGLQTRDLASVVFGSVVAAALALVLDGLLAGIERGVARGRRGLVAACALGLLGVLGGGLGASLARPSAAVVLGAKPFTEQYVLAHLMERRAADAGLTVSRREGLGSMVAFDALVAGQLDAYVEYTGTLWATVMKREGTADGPTVRRTVCAWLEREHAARCLGPLGFANNYALATKGGVTSIASLAAEAPGLTIGADYEFFGRPEWEALRRAYGLRFAEQRTMDPTFLYDALDRGDVDVIPAYTSDGRIAAFGLTVLEDEAQVLPPYDAVILVADGAPAALVDALQPLVGAVPVDAMRAANAKVDADGLAPEEAAAWLDARTGRQ